MKIKVRNTYENLYLFLIVILMFSYAGIIASYKSCTVFSNFVLLLIIFEVYRRKIKLIKIEKSWIVLAIYMSLILIFNFPKSSLYLLLFILGIFILHKKNTENYFNKLIRVCKIISTILATSILVQWLLPDLFYKFAQKYYFYSNQYEMVYNSGMIAHKYSGLIYEVSFAAFVLSIGFACYFSDMICKKVKTKWSMLALMYIYFAIILTDKRSFILIVPSIVCIVTVIFEMKKISIKYIIIFFVVLFLLLFNINTIISIVSNILSDGTETVLQLSSRDKYWNIILDMIKQSPLIGTGLNSFDHYFNLAHIKSIHLEFVGAHNSYLQIIAEMGFIGAVLYFTNIIKICFRAIKILNIYRISNNENLNKVVISLFILLVCSLYALTGNVFHQPQQLITFFVFGNIIINEYENLKMQRFNI
ncbi:MAG: O-antigen ligase family protein [Clostridium sp.]|nr:O-antigen ligase family protein [Clostridium sp.]MDU7084333.1 O-antigen ligase family protein [Clostridium sp.]